MDQPPDPLLEQVRETAEGFEVFGELGRHSDADIWYLAREEGTEVLVALRLSRKEARPDAPAPEYNLEVARELSGQVALGLGDCPRCGAALRAWARFCGKCGADVSGAAAMPADPEARADLLEQVREAAGEVYRVLGEMPWAGGGGLVYFALEKESGRLVRLRLQASTEGMALAETRMVVPLDRLAADYVSEVTLPPVPAPPPPSNAPSTPVRPRTALLIGGVVAGIVLLILLALLR